MSTRSSAKMFVNLVLSLVILVAGVTVLIGLFGLIADIFGAV
ncbi:hypothetical protein [Paraburkholderia ginsengisoli]|nr:hypothetical protein [Paraburkholderia ginsengisoli]